MMKDSKTQLYCSKFKWARQRISPKIFDNLGTCSKKFRQPCPRRTEAAQMRFSRPFIGLTIIDHIRNDENCQKFRYVL